MGERKVLNKYYPQDFDRAKLPRRPKNQQIKVRTMLSMTIRCGTCGNFINKGTKFNCRKENVIGENYLGIKIYRFYFKCTKCAAEMTIKTDPQNSDYIVEFGASRNFEPWRAEDHVIEKKKRKRDAEEMGDSMKSLENRTVASKREMDVLVALDEMKSMKSRHATVSVDAMLEALQHINEEKAKKREEEDEVAIRALYKGLKEKFVKQIDDEDVRNNFSSGAGLEKPNDSPTKSSFSESLHTQGGSKPTTDQKLLFKSPSVTVTVRKKSGDVVSNTGLLSLCQEYGSDDDE